MIDKFIKYLKRLFHISSYFISKVNTPEYFTGQVKMSKLKFGDMRRQYQYKNGIEIELDTLSNENFEIWRVYKGKDEYGDVINMFEELGYYSGKKKIFYFREELKQYFDNKYFEEELY